MNFMHKASNYYIDLDSRIEKLLRNSEFLGQGHNGIVFLLPTKQILKIFKDEKICDKEYNILKGTKNSKYFPKVYDHGPFYIIREYVGGEPLHNYIKKYGLKREIAAQIIKLIKEFERLGFRKLDIRCKDIYVGNDSLIKVIDPKNNYSKDVTYPRHLMKGLYKLDVLDEFLAVVKDEYNEVYEPWSLKIRQYLESGIK